MTEPRLSSVSAFFPCYNDANTIPLLVKSVEATLREITDDYEVIVVNDASTDDSARVLEELRGEVPSLRVIEHTKNQGYGGALRSGFLGAAKDYVFYTDGDGQYDPRQLTRLLDLAGPEVDLVQGYKRNRADSVARTVVGRVYARAVQFAFGLPVRDVDCDFRLIRRSLLERCDLRASSGGICAELVRGLTDAGARIVEVEVDHHPRRHGRSQFFRPRRILETFVELGRLRARLARRRSR